MNDTDPSHGHPEMNDSIPSTASPHCALSGAGASSPQEPGATLAGGGAVDRVGNAMRDAWIVQILDSLKEYSAHELEEMLSIITGVHRESIMAAMTIRQHDGMARDTQMLTAALGCPYLKPGEAEEWQKINHSLRAKPKKIAPANHGFVYLMRNMRNGMTKIGFSKNPTFREKTLQSEEPEIMILGRWRGTITEEQTLHRHYQSKRIRGEWFQLSDEDIDDIRTTLALGLARFLS